MDLQLANGYSSDGAGLDFLVLFFLQFGRLSYMVAETKFYRMQLLTKIS